MDRNRRSASRCGLKPADLRWPTRLQPVNGLSVDVEDWFQVGAFETVIARETWNRLDCRVERNCDAVLAMFADAGVTGTFFTLGWVAQRYPALMRRIADSGHELASHGWDHARVFTLGPVAFADDLARTRAVIEDVSGQAVRGYRAPSFSIDQRTPWAHRVLAEQGYLYSSSVAPIAHDHYGWPEAPRFAFRPVDGAPLIEIPVTTAELAGRRIAAGGGGFFRVLPYGVSRWAIRQVNRREGRPAVFYFHPWEIDPAQPRVTHAPLRSRLRHYSRLDVMEAKLRQLIGEFRWGRMDALAAREAPRGVNAPFVRTRTAVRLADARDAAAVAGFLAAHPDSTPFHGSAWLGAVERATGHRVLTLLCESNGSIIGVLPLHAVHSPLFGRALVSTGFAVGGGILAETQTAAGRLAAAAEELAARLASPSVELRGGPVPQGIGWRTVDDRHAGFVAPLQPDDDAQLLAIPRKQRAEVRKALSSGLTVRVGRGAQDRDVHYALYAESVRNLGTPVFPRALFAAVIEAFGDDADILTVLDGDDPVASVLSLYHRGAVMPYWGGGGVSARRLRANELLYFGLMRHARKRGCDRFDFGRSKLGSGAYHFKRNWGFAPEPLTYAVWTAGGCAPRDTDPTSPANRAKVALWQRLPLRLANRLGPLIARGLA